MEEQIKKVRTEELRVKVTPEMKRRVDRIAEMHGMPSVTWANHVISKAVVDFERHYQLQNKSVEAMAKVMQELVEPLLHQAAEQGQLIDANQEAAKGQPEE